MACGPGRLPADAARRRGREGGPTDTTHIPDARLPELLNDATARPEDLAHVRDCPQCAERVAGMKRVVGVVEKLRGRVPPEVVARFQAKLHDAMERGGASAAASANVDAMLSSLLDPSAAPRPPAAPGGAGPSGATPAPFDPPEAPPPPRSRRSSRDDAIEHITMPSSAAESAGLPAPYEAEASSGLLDQLGLHGRKLLALVLVLLVMALGIAFLLSRRG